MRSRQKPTLPLRFLFLLSDAELLDDCSVSLDVYSLKVAKKVSSVTNHFKKTATAVMVVVVVLKMLVERVDSVSKDSNLYFGRTCVALVCCVLSDYCLLFVLQHDFFTFHKFI